MNFATLQGLTIPEGVVTQIADASGRVLWKLETSEPVVLQVEKITSNTYAGETTYTGEQFVLLDIYPKTNGTVKVTYGGLTKTITDTSGAEEPNAQQVFFGTFNGVSDSVATPASGELTIEGGYVAFGSGQYIVDSKNLPNYCACVTEIVDFGSVEYIPVSAFANLSVNRLTMTAIEIPKTVKRIYASSFANAKLLEAVTIGECVTFIGNAAFFSCPVLTTIKVLGTTPAELEYNSNTESYNMFGELTDNACALEKIIVPKGCVNAYKAAEGWSTYADYIVEAS